MYYPQSPKTKISPFHIKNNMECRQSLLLELQRYLITFDPLTFVLYLRIRIRKSPSPLFVQLGSWDFILHLAIQFSLSISPNIANLTFSIKAFKLQYNNYGPFNCSNFHRHSWSWYYRGCWHQNLPSNCIKTIFLQLFLIITFHNCLLIKEWTIFAPAAVLGRGSHLSGSLSGIKP